MSSEWDIKMSAVNCIDALIDIAVNCLQFCGYSEKS